MSGKVEEKTEEKGRDEDGKPGWMKSVILPGEDKLLETDQGANGQKGLH